jgi:hypothetical protein
MPTLLDAAKLSQIPYTVAQFKAIATSDRTFALLDFVPKDGHSFSYSREKSLPSFGFIPDNYAGDIPESTGTDEKVTVPKRQAVSDFNVDAFDVENQSGLVSQMEIQTKKKFKAAGRKLADKVINGRNNTGFVCEAFQSGAYVDAVQTGPWIDSNRFGSGLIKYTHAGTLVQWRAPGDAVYGPAVAAATDGNYLLLGDNPNKYIVVTLDVSDATANAERVITFTSSTDDFDGLKYLISSGQTRSASGANGDNISFTILDELIDSVKERDPTKMAFSMHSTLVQRIKSLMRAADGITPIQLPNNMGQVPSYEGIPILANDWITKDESKGSATTLSSIYLVNYAAEQGFWMGALGGGRFEVEADPRNVSVLGFRLTELGPIQKGSGNKVGRRLAWYGSPALGSDLAAARAKEIITAAT